MQQESFRPLRIGEQLSRELAGLLRAEVKDPRIPEIVIYDIVVSRDLSLAKVYYSHLDSKQDTTESLKGLQSASGFLRTRLSNLLNLRKMPRLRFIVDDTEMKSARIEKLIESSSKR
ncbi:MAG: 30S ribosome-binding factor RbfA [Gammaproteobacteria bacterium]|nr:30S ribosome-binding factor RbfA [Gammaproteobacteria bacterium]